MGKGLVNLPKERVSEEQPLPQNIFHRVLPTPKSVVVTVTTVPQDYLPDERTSRAPSSKKSQNARKRGLGKFMPLMMVLTESQGIGASSNIPLTF